MDFTTFCTYHVPALEKNEARHNLMLGLLSRLARQAERVQAQFWSLGEPGACVLRSDRSHGLILGELNREQCHQLAEQVAGTWFQGVIGPDDTAHWFAERARELGAQFGEPEARQIHSLEGAPLPPQTEGSLRQITAEDSDRFAEWFTAFSIAVAPQEPPLARHLIDEKAVAGDCFFWQVNGEPVAMAGVARRMRKGATLSYVYTAPQMRNKGYAASVAAAVAERIRAEGFQMVCLYVDSHNTVAQRCYERIGFRWVCNGYHIQQAGDPQQSVKP